MASKFIILAVFAVAAQSAAVAERSTLEDELSKIKSLGVVTLNHLTDMINVMYGALDGKELSPSAVKEIEDRAAEKFRKAYDSNMDILLLVSENPSVIDDNTEAAHAALNRVISTMMTMLGKTETSAIEEESVGQLRGIWRDLYELYIKAIAGNEAITAAIKQVEILATDSVECAARAISTAIRFFNKNSEKYQPQIKFQWTVTLIAKIAEILEKYSLDQYIIAHKYDEGNADIDAFTVIVKSAYEDIFAFRELMEIAANCATVENYDDFEETIYRKFVIAVEASERSIKLIQSGVSDEIDTSSILELVKVAAAGIRQAAEIANKQAEGDMEEVREKVVANVQAAFHAVYIGMIKASEHVPGAKAEIEDAEEQAATGIAKTFGYLFEAMQGKLGEGYVIIDLAYVFLEVHLMRKFDMLRAYLLCTSIQNNGVEVPLSALLNDAVKAATKTEL